MSVPEEHHTVIIVGGGPAGLALSVVLGGWHPYYRESPALRERYPQIADYVAAQAEGGLLKLRMRDLVQANLPPVDLFRILHHPRQMFIDLNQIAMEFRRSDPIDYLLVTQEEVGGLWNNAPHNLLTLSPGHWMELAFYPLAQYKHETGKQFGVTDLIKKTDLIDYYHSIPARFEQQIRIRTHQRVTCIEPHERGFKVTARDVSGFQVDAARRTCQPPVPQPGDDISAANERCYTCQYVVYATGQRAILRRLDVEGEDLAFVDQYYDRAEDYDGDRVLVVGGGRSADWAATELHDAGKQVCYVMRQSRERHWKLIGDSRGGLPYYARIAEILEGDSPRLEVIYEAHIRHIEQVGDSGRVTVWANGSECAIDVDHVVKEIGAWADYSPIQGFPPLQLVETRDPYRFQVHQARTHAHNYESIDIPNLYLGGYLAQGVGLVVIAMHGCTYAIAADILEKESLL